MVAPLAIAFLFIIDYTEDVNIFFVSLFVNDMQFTDGIRTEKGLNDVFSDRIS